MSKVLPTSLLRRVSQADRKAMGKAGQLPEEAQVIQEAKNEKELQGQIAGYLRRNDIWFDQDATHKRRTGTKGTPDFIFSVDGMAIAIEVKFAKGTCSHEQEVCHTQMRRNGWDVYVLRSYEEFLKVMSEIGY